MSILITSGKLFMFKNERNRNTFIYIKSIDRLKFPRYNFVQLKNQKVFFIIMILKQIYALFFFNLQITEFSMQMFSFILISLKVISFVPTTILLTF